MEYTIVMESEISRLIVNVNELIDDGWSPQGGVSVVVNPNGVGEHFQARVKLKTH